MLRMIPTISPRTGTRCLNLLNFCAFCVLVVGMLLALALITGFNLAYEIFKLLGCGKVNYSVSFLVLGPFEIVKILRTGINRYFKKF